MHYTDNQCIAMTNNNDNNVTLKRQVRCTPKIRLYGGSAYNTEQTVRNVTVPEIVYARFVFPIVSDTDCPCSTLCDIRARMFNDEHTRRCTFSRDIGTVRRGTFADSDGRASSPCTQQFSLSPARTGNAVPRNFGCWMTFRNSVRILQPVAGYNSVLAVDSNGIRPVRTLSNLPESPDSRLRGDRSRIIVPDGPWRYKRTCR